MGGLRGSLWVSVGGGGENNQSKSVPMMPLHVVANINQSNSRCLRGSPWVSRRWSPQVSAGWSPWVVSMGGLRRSPQVVVGKINQSKSVSMMSLNVVGNINQSNSRCLCRSLQVVSVGSLHG